MSIYWKDISIKKVLNIYWIYPGCVRRECVIIELDSTNLVFSWAYTYFYKFIVFLADAFFAFDLKADTFKSFLQTEATNSKGNILGKQTSFAQSLSLQEEITVNDSLITSYQLWSLLCIFNDKTLQRYWDNS